MRALGGRKGLDSQHGLDLEGSEEGGHFNVTCSSINEYFEFKIFIACIYIFMYVYMYIYICMQLQFNYSLLVNCFVAHLLVVAATHPPTHTRPHTHTYTHRRVINRPFAL